MDGRQETTLEVQGPGRLASHGADVGDDAIMEGKAKDLILKLASEEILVPGWGGSAIGPSLEDLNLIQLLLRNKQIQT